MGRKQTLLGVFLKKACNGVVQEWGSSRGPAEMREWADFWLTQLWTLINSLVFLLGPVNTLARSWRLPGTIFRGWQPGPGPVCVCVSWACWVWKHSWESTLLEQSLCVSLPHSESLPVCGSAWSSWEVSCLLTGLGVTVAVGRSLLVWLSFVILNLEGKKPVVPEIRLYPVLGHTPQPPPFDVASNGVFKVWAWNEHTLTKWVCLWASHEPALGQAKSHRLIRNFHDLPLSMTF